MADLTQFTSSPPAFEGRHVVTEFVTESQYESIMYNNTGTPDPANPLFDPTLVDPAFVSTLYYIRENA